jgi:hypothetical protein
MNDELAAHISLLAAPIYATLIARPKPPSDVTDEEYRGLAIIAAIRMARELWEATLKA